MKLYEVCMQNLPFVWSWCGSAYIAFVKSFTVFFAASHISKVPLFRFSNNSSELTFHFDLNKRLI